MTASDDRYFRAAAWSAFELLREFGQATIENVDDVPGVRRAIRSEGYHQRVKYRTVVVRSGTAHRVHVFALEPSVEAQAYRAATESLAIQSAGRRPPLINPAVWTIDLAERP